MTDNGVAPDEVAGDGIYTAVVTVAAATTAATNSLAAVPGWCSALGTTYYIWIAPSATGASTASFTLAITDNGTACTTAFPCPTCLGVSGPYTETEPGYGLHTDDGCG